MTVVNPDSIAGITSVTSSGTTLEFYDVNGNLLDVSANLTGELTVGTGATISSPGASIIDFETNGSERLRIGSSGQIGIAGANYGSSGQVLTSAGSGSAVSWSTILTLNNNADNRVITGGSGVNLNGEANLTYDGTTLQVQSSGSGLRNLLRLKNSNASAGTSGLYFNSTTSGSAFDAACVRNGVNGSGQGRLFLQTNNGSGLVNGLEIEYDGQVTLPTNSLNILDSIVHIGDTNTKIRFPAADTVSVETGGDERLRIDSSGRLIVGDNTNRLVWGINPHLQVNGTDWDDSCIAIHNFGNNTRRPTLLFTKGKSGTLGNFGTSPAAGDGLGIIGWSAHDTTDAENLACYIQGITEQVATANNQYGAITFTTVNGGTTAYERLRIASDGDTTISTSGTTMLPGAALNVISDKNVETGVDDKANYHLVLANPNNDTGEAIGLAFGITDTTAKVGAAIIHERDAAGSQGSMQFLTRPSNSGPPVERLRIGSSGNFGFATSNVSGYPGHTNLFIGGMANLYAETSAGSGSSTSWSNNAYIQNSGGWVRRTTGYSTNIYQYNGGIGFRWGASGSGGGSISWNEAMRLTNDGKLHIGDSIGTAHSGKFQVIHEGGGNQTNDCLAFFETNANDWVMLLNSNEGGSNSHYHIYFQEEGSARGNISGGHGSNVNYNQGSDYRWKENIVDLTGSEGIDICKKLKPRKYNWIKNREGTGKINTVDGFIAHEVAESGVLGAVTGEKDAVKEDGSIDGQMLDYGQMTPVLAAAIKGLIDKVETLEAKVAANEAGDTTYNAKIDKIIDYFKL